MSTALPQFVIRFGQLRTHLRSKGWTWPFTLTGNLLRPIGMCSPKDAYLIGDNDNRWRANAPR